MYTEDRGGVATATGAMLAFSSRVSPFELFWLNVHTNLVHLPPRPFVFGFVAPLRPLHRLNWWERCECANMPCSLTTGASHCTDKTRCHDIYFCWKKKTRMESCNTSHQTPSGTRQWVAFFWDITHNMCACLTIILPLFRYPTQLRAKTRITPEELHCWLLALCYMLVHCKSATAAIAACGSPTLIPVRDAICRMPIQFSSTVACCCTRLCTTFIFQTQTVCTRHSNVDATATTAGAAAAVGDG